MELIPIKELANKYSITKDGEVYSHIKNRYLMGSINGSGYKFYFLKSNKGDRWYFTHRLVYVTYVGRLKKKLEINHKDMNKLNNHWSNLEQTTHKDNMIKARRTKHWTGGRKGGWPMPQSTKDKIGIANGRKILVNNHLCSSIGDAAIYLGVSYTTVCRALKHNRLINGHIVKGNDFPK